MQVNILRICEIKEVSKLLPECYILVTDESLYNHYRNHFPSKNIVLIKGWEQLNEILQTIEDVNLPVVAFGGGTVIDMCKLACHNFSKELIVVPSVLSHDGFNSPSVSLGGGKSVKVDIKPKEVIIPIDIIKKAPKRMNFAGWGDLIAKYSSLLDLIDGQKKGYYEEIKENIYENVINELNSVLKCEKKINELYTESDLKVLAKLLYKSGEIMRLFGSSVPASGSEHAIYHAIVSLGYSDELKKYGIMHGHIVGYATLYILKLREKEKMYKYLKDKFEKFSNEAKFNLDALEKVFKEHEKEILQRAKEILKERERYGIILEDM